jgi:hypothetical protein
MTCVPVRAHVLNAALTIPVAEVEARVVHEHVMKHPLGLGVLYDAPPMGGIRRWDKEGWSALEPPLVTAELRRALASLILSLDVDGERCGARLLGHDEYGGATGDVLPCRSCPERVLAACATHVEGLRRAYLARIDAILGALHDAVAVDRVALTQRLFNVVRLHRSTGVEAWPAAVLSVGLLDDGRRALRVRTREGFTLDFYGRPPKTRWRTLHREIHANANDRVSFLLHVLKPDPNNPLSAQTLVPRLWWEQNPA